MSTLVQSLYYIASSGLSCSVCGVVPLSARAHGHRARILNLFALGNLFLVRRRLMT